MPRHHYAELEARGLKRCLHCTRLLPLEAMQCNHCLRPVLVATKPSKANEKRQRP